MAVLSAAALLSGCAIASVAGASHNYTELISTGPTDGNRGCGDFCSARVSDNGSKVLFVTKEDLVPQDTDGLEDLYVRTAGLTTLIPVGATFIYPTAIFHSRDMSRIFFNTTAQLVPEDVDVLSDVYQWSNGVFTLVSAGPSGGNGAWEALPVGASRDGSRVFFRTNETLVPEDLDLSDDDLYQHAGGQTTLLSTGSLDAGGPNSFSRFGGVSADGTRVFFTGEQQLEPGDTDSRADVYERSGGTTTLISTGPAGGNGDQPAFFDDSSDAGGAVIFSTRESLVSTDTDGGINDIYERNGSTTALVSTGPADSQTTFACSEWPSNGPACPTAISGDGSRVTFLSAESLLPGDTDGRLDVYQHTAGNVSLISTGPTDAGAGVPRLGGPFAASTDGSHVFFRTPDPLTTEDVDASGVDIYERSNGVTQLVSNDPGTNDAGDPFVGSVSEDGSRVIFGRSGHIYERAGGQTTLISTGPLDDGNVEASFRGASADGRTVAFTTDSKLVPGDPDNFDDIYTRTIVVAPASYDTPQTATTIRASLVPMLRQTISTSQCQARGGTVSSHGAPLAFSSCNPPGYVPGTAAHMGPGGQGSYELSMVPGDPVTPADEADVALTVVATDVRNRQTGGDYDPAAGTDVTLNARFRLTDNLNGAGQSDPATTSDFDFAIPVGCIATEDAGAGSSCQLSSSMDVVMPGAIREGKATVMAAWKLWLYDSGTNGSRGDGDDKQFAQAGIYIP